MSETTSSLPYRKCVGIMLLNAERRVFVGQRIDQSVESWQMPQGGIDPGETPEDAAMRELAEEVGTNNAEIIGIAAGWINYDLPADLIGKALKGRYRGQTQKWFAMRFLGDDAEINIRTKHPEFGAWQWVSANETLDMIVPFKRSVYEQVIEEFKALLKS
jgi:putative (di)nucleoside polyphosphate hydrolase